MRGITRIVAVTLILLLAQCCVAGADVITVDPNIPGNRESATADAPDTRLAQKVSYECRTQPTRKILDDLSEMTGVYLISGKSRLDWQVRDAKMIIAVEGVTLAELMNSIARVMHFNWSISGEGTERSYRLVDDDEAVRKVEAQIRQAAQDLHQAKVQALKRVRAVADVGAGQLAELKDTNPYLYYLGKTGIAKAYVDLARNVPGLEKAVIEGREFFAPAEQLSPQAKQARTQFALAVLGAGYRDEKIPPEITERIGDLGVVCQSLDESQVLPARANGRFARFGIGNGGFPGYSLLLQDPDKDAVKVNYKYRVTYLEIGRDAWHTVTPQDRKIIEAGYASPSMYVEPLKDHPDHPDLPELSKKITLECYDQKEKVFLQVAGELGLNLVADSYKRYQYRKMRVSLKDAEIYDLLDTITYRNQNSPPYNWDKPSSIIEISHRNWYFQRQYEIPDAWLEKWRAVVTETGTLDLEQLAEVAALDDGLYWLNVGNDKVLHNSFLGHQIRRSKEYLKVYNTLTQSQRSVLLSKRGLSLASLNADQQQAVFKIISGLNVPEGLPDLRAVGLDVRATASRVKDGKRFIYTFRGNINGVPLPGEYILSTPDYEDYPREPDTSEKERE